MSRSGSILLTPLQYFLFLPAIPCWLRPARTRSGSQYLLSSRQKVVVSLDIPMLVAQLASCHGYHLRWCDEALLRDKLKEIASMDKGKFVARASVQLH